MIEYEFEKRQRAEMLQIHETLAEQEAELATMQAAAAAENEERDRRARNAYREYFQDGM